MVLLLIVRTAVLFLPLILSSRTVLVALGAGYIVAGLYQSRSAVAWFLGGVLLVSFSSSAVLVCLLCVLATHLIKHWSGASRFSRWITAAALVLLLLPSMAAKVDGFASGADGYTTIEEAAESQARFEQLHYDKPLVEQSLLNLLGVPSNTGVLEGPLQFVDRVLSRSTLYVSFAYGQYSRLLLYLGMILAVLLSVLLDVRRQRAHAVLVPMLVLVLGLFLEGLGAWTVFWPLLWRYTGRDLSAGWVFPRDPSPETDRRKFEEAIG